MSPRAGLSLVKYFLAARRARLTEAEHRLFGKQSGEMSSRKRMRMQLPCQAHGAMPSQATPCANGPQALTPQPFSGSYSASQGAWMQGSAIPPPSYPGMHTSFRHCIFHTAPRGFHDDMLVSCTALHLRSVFIEDNPAVYGSAEGKELSRSSRRSVCGLSRMME